MSTFFAKDMRTSACIQYISRNILTFFVLDCITQPIYFLEVCLQSGEWCTNFAWLNVQLIIIIIKNETGA